MQMSQTAKGGESGNVSGTVTLKVSPKNETEKQNQ
jgi:hypothetical protein